MNKKKSMKKQNLKKLFVLFVIFVGISVYFASCRISPKLQDEYIRGNLSKDIRSVFNEHKQSIPGMMKKNKIPGLSIAVVNRNGILWTAGFGYTDYSRKKPVTTNTIFLLCSMSKTFTATAVMCAVQDGLINLDAPVTEYIPEFTVNSRFEENPHDKITLRNLLNHTSGLDHETTVGNGKEPKGVSFEDHINSISNTWLKSHVGKRWSYSGIGYDLAGYILQIRSGKPFAEYMKEKIFEPLKMPNTSLDPVFIKNHDNRAVGHYKHYKKLPLEIPVPAAGGVYSSARELARFVQFHLNYGSLDNQTILSENLVKQMYSPSPTTSRQYGLGLEYYPTKGRGHGGAGFGFSSVMVWAPDYGVGALILINELDSDNNREQHRIQVYSLLRKLLDNEGVEKIDSFMENAIEVEPVKYQLPDPANFTPYKPDWKKYVGTYRYLYNGRKLCLYADIALALGYPDPGMYEKVYEKDGFLEISGRRLDEHLPGLFFSSDGYRLDFRGSVPTWQNFRMKKTKRGKVPKLKVKATWPNPTDGRTVRPGNKVKLSWKSGDTAKLHRIYLGTDKSDLMFLTETSSSEYVAELAISEKDTIYYWRVDEVEANGTVRAGYIWRFCLGKLVGWWQLDGNAKDSSGNNHHGIIKGNPTWVSGRIDRALQLDGVDDYVDIGIIDSPVWALAFWVKSSEAPSSGPQRGPVTWEPNFYINWDDPDPVFQGAANLQIMGTRNDATFGTLNANTWYHLCVTYDGKRLKTYKNGDLITDNSCPSFFQGVNGINLVFGKHSAEHYFSGIFDDVRAYNYVIKHEDTIELFKLGNEQ